MSARSIQRALSGWFAVQTLIGLSLICTGVYTTTRWNFQRKQEQALVQHVDLVRHVVAETRQPLDLSAMRHKLDDYFSSHADITVALKANRHDVYATPRTPAGGHHLHRTVVQPDLTIDGHPLKILLTMDVSGDAMALRQLGWTLVAAAACGTFIVSATGAWLVRRGLRPLKALAAETAEAGPGNPGHRIETARYAVELRPWIVQFNGLLSRADDAYAQLEAFNADVAHELRTPLANMIAQAEIELGQPRSAGELEDTLASQLEEARRLSVIVTDMLFLSKAELGARARRGPLEELADQVIAVTEYFEAALDERRLEVRIDGHAQLHMDTRLVRRALSNLMSNALRYAEAGSTVRVALARTGDLVQLSVENAGEPIDPQALPRLFERFFRADPSRVESTVHHGLGLAIVAAIARMHGGQPFAECRAGLTRIGLTLRDTPDETAA